MQYVDRSSAMRAAKSRGFEYFRTMQHPIDRTWSAVQTHVKDVPALAFADGKDFVAWVEAFIDENGTVRPVLIVSCTHEELAEENIPADTFVIEPQVAELWETTHGATRSVRTPKSREPRAERAPDAEREKSAVASPTKLVWSIADTMPTADRKAIINACVAQGVHPATASTQFSKWKKARSA